MRPLWAWFAIDRARDRRLQVKGLNSTKISTAEYPRPESEEEFQAMLKSGTEEGWNSSLNLTDRFL
jgi:hypothetical protein